MSAPPRQVETSARQADAFFGVRLTAAVNLLEARDYAGLDLDSRLRKALGEQEGLLAALLGFAGRAAFDLRTVVDPTGAVPFRIAIVGRAWAADATRAEELAADARSYLVSSLPSHLSAEPITDDSELDSFLEPFPGDLESVLLTKKEVTGLPSRPDAGVDEYFSVVPLQRTYQDWTGLYEVLAASRTPVVLSVGLFPIETPQGLRDQLAQLGTWYGRLAKEGQRQGGIYFGAQQLAPDAFAVEAEQVFQDLLRRCAHRAFVLRVQVSAPRLPVGVVEAFGAAIAPLDAETGSHMEHRRAGAGYGLRPFDAPEGAEDAAHNLRHIDRRMPARLPHGDGRLSDRLGHLALLVDPVEASAAFRLPVAATGRVPGFSVRRGTFGHEETFAATGRSIALGRLGGGTRGLRLSVDSLTRHALVVGTTGSGKTTTTLGLLRALWAEHGIPFLVIEPVNSDADDYRALRHDPSLADLRVITAGDERFAPLRFNPFEVPKGVLVSEHQANLLASFKAAFGLWEPLPSIYQRAIETMYERMKIFGSMTSDDSIRRWPTATEFLSAMRAVTRDLPYAGEVRSNIEAASVQRAQQMVAGVTASVFATDRSLDFGDLLAHPTVLELKALGQGDEQALVMALLLNGLTEYYKANRGAVSTLQHLTVIEEAHRLLARAQGGASSEQAQAKEKAAESFANTLAENRKYGEGLLIAEQIPSKLVVDAVKNTHLKVMHRLASDEDRTLVGETMGLDESQSRFAVRLEAGEALVYGDNYAEAAHVAVDRTVTGAPLPAEVVASPPFDACAPCTAKCVFRGAAMAVARSETIGRRLDASRAALTTPGTTPDGVRAAWTDYVAELREVVREQPALRREAGGEEAAAYCLHLHFLGTKTMTYSAQSVEPVSRRLGLTTATRSA